MSHHDHLDSHGLPSRTPAPLRPCDLFSEEIHLLVDRELGEAERQVVEEHLGECARCLGLAQHLERMSSVLKAWDQRENDIPAPDLRLQHGVLARVADSSARRRRDDRFVRVLHMATAAVVLVGLGLAVLFGVAASDHDQPRADQVVSKAPWPLENRERPVATLPTEPFEDRLTAADLLAGVEAPVLADLAGDPGVVTDEHMQLFEPGDNESLVNLDVRVKRLAQFMDRFGERAMYWNGPYASGADQRVVPERTYRWLLDQGVLERWHHLSTRTSPTVASAARTARPSEEPVARQATGVLARDMLRPMPGITHPLRLSASSRLTYLPGMHPFRTARTKSGKPKSTRGLPPLIEIRAITDPVANIPGLRSGPLGAPNRAFLDPLDAWANGQLRFAESQHDAGRIVAFVKNTKKPIFIPAGQFVTDGHGDRVVRHPIWLPASRGETPHIVHCFVVQAMPRFEPQGAPQLSPHIAGPTVRALLAAGATQAQVKAAAKAICEAHATYFGAPLPESWSLRAFYTNALVAKSGAGQADPFGRVRWKGSHGFLATDAQGRFLGFELVRIAGPSAEALLGRLWRGYAVEAIWRIQSSGLRDAFAAPSDGAQRVLALLGSHPAGFRIPAGSEDVDGARVSTLELQASGVHLHALEVDERAAVVSGLSSIK